MISITLKTLRKDKKIECFMSYTPCRCGIHFMQLNVIILFHGKKLLNLWAKRFLHLPDSYELHFYKEVFITLVGRHYNTACRLVDFTGYRETVAVQY